MKDRPPKEKVKLSREEKKQIAALIRQAKGDGKKHTAQQTIPYETMFPDGICPVSYTHLDVYKRQLITFINPFH